jgi:hypothetical protein
MGRQWGAPGQGTGKGWKPDRSWGSAGTPPALLAEVERFPLARDTTSARIPCHVTPHHRGRPARAGTGLSSRKWQARTWAGGGQKVGTIWEATGSANEALLDRFSFQRIIQAASPGDANPRQPAWKAGGCALAARLIYIGLTAGFIRCMCSVSVPGKRCRARFSPNLEKPVTYLCS